MPLDRAGLATPTLLSHCLLSNPTDQGYLPKGGKPMEILRLEGIEVWNEAGTRTLDDQSVVQASTAALQGFRAAA